MIRAEGGGGCFRLEGPVTLDNVCSIREEGGRLLAEADLTVDLSGLTEVDSSAVSLLLEWVREARAGGRQIRYTGLTPNLRSLIELYGVGELIPDAGH